MTYVISLGVQSSRDLLKPLLFHSFSFKKIDKKLLKKAFYRMLLQSFSIFRFFKVIFSDRSQPSAQSDEHSEIGGREFGGGGAEGLGRGLVGQGNVGGHPQLLFFVVKKKNNFGF